MQQGFFLLNQSATGGGGFDPNDFGATMWISADQVSLSSLSDGDPITDWLDRITGTRKFLGASTARALYQTNEVNSLPVAQFDASNDRMNYDNGSGSPVPSSSIWSASANTTFAVIRPQTAGHASMSESGKNIITANGFLGICLLASGGNKFAFYRFNGGYVGAISTTTYSTGSVYVVECWYDGTNLNIKVNNDTLVSQAASNPSSLADAPQISFAAAMGADLAEIITFNTSLSSGDRTIIREALADKWGVTLL